ncbi:MAG: hypothetical protein DMG06_26425 [Acidobacteria bacterium]|nr:MAG: hypothetical protein DMG06_26425 [Acidobacteriota bacterium]
MDGASSLLLGSRIDSSSRDLSPCENNGNLSPDRQGGVGPADCLNRSLTVAARYRILLRNPPQKRGKEAEGFWGVVPSASTARYQKDNPQG